MGSLAELDDRELLALAGLLRVLVRLDGMASAAELAALDAIGDELGRDKLDSLIRRAAAELESTADVERIALEVENPGSRELIYGALFDVAASDSILQPESYLLDWLREHWHLNPAAGPYRS